MIEIYEEIMEEKAFFIFQTEVIEKNWNIEIGSCLLREFKNTIKYNLENIISSITNTINEKYTIESIKNAPNIKAFRKFYWTGLNIDPTKIRPAAEALIRRVLKKKNLPRISALVDSYNWASVLSQIPMGAYDLDKIKLPIILRFTEDKEYFHPIGKNPLILLEKTLVIADADGKILCQYPYRDSNITKITKNTKNALILAYGAPKIDHDSIKNALDITCQHLNSLKENSELTFKAQPFQFFKTL